MLIKNNDILEHFLENFLPELQENEAYFFAIFARSKYDPSGIVKSSQSLLHRFTASSRKHALVKLQEFNDVEWRYKGQIIPQEATALYVHINPRDLHRASITLMKKLLDMMGTKVNPASQAMSAIQKTKSRKTYVHFDLDTDQSVNWEKAFYQIFNDFEWQRYTHVLKTRGGYHILIEPKEASKANKKFYVDLISYFGDQVDATGDMMLPVPGGNQGGFTPYFLNL